MAQRKITILDKAPEPAHHPLGMTLGEKNSASYFDKPFTSPQSPFPELGLRNETPREHYAGSLADPAETDAKWFLLTE